jgi:DNA adenine methylase
MSNIKTPLRYPGGKQRLTPFIKEILLKNKITEHYVEPYAGGAGVGIDLLLNKKIDFIHLNDANIGIYAFWHSVINNTEKLCKLISSASMTVEEWLKRKQIVKTADRTNLLELGFSIFYLNRCNRSGILSAGVIGGLDQTGNYKMDARFSRNDLIRRIESIALFKEQIFVTNFDAEFYINNYIPNLGGNCLVYLDPPYYEKGSNLYLNFYNKEDHESLSKIIQKEIHQNWILSYDGVPEIVKLYSKRRHFIYDLQYNAEKVYKGKEIFIFCDKMKLPKSCSLEYINEGIENMINPKKKACR